MQIPNTLDSGFMSLNLQTSQETVENQDICASYWTPLVSADPPGCPKEHPASRSRQDTSKQSNLKSRFIRDQSGRLIARTNM